MECGNVDPSDASVVKDRDLVTMASNAASSNGSDRLSSLPLSIIHYIFSFLETVDIVRASAIARKWRYFWISTPYLNFHSGICWLLYLKHGHRIIGKTIPLKDRFSSLIFPEGFIAFVDRVLMSQDASISIQQFRFWARIEVEEDTLYRWIHLLVRRNVKELELYVDNYDPFELPHVFNNCKSLVALRLKLRNSLLRPLRFENFSQLKSLAIHNMILDLDSFQDIISNCCLLENLKIKRCELDGFKIFDLSAPRLKSFSISKCYLGFDCCEVNLACPNLKSLMFNASIPQDISFPDLKFLQKVVLDLFSYFCSIEGRSAERVKCLVRKVFEGIRHTKFLELTWPCLQYIIPLAESGCSIAPFGNLISLTLEVLDLEFVTRGVGYVFIFCPFLEALSLRLEWRNEDGLRPEFIYQMPDIAIPGVTNCLKTIEIDHFMGYDDKHKCIRHDGQLVKFLLKHGQVLQKLDITFACKYSDSTEARHMRSRMVEEFPRASPHVEIKFYYYPQHLLPEKGDIDISEIEITPIY